MPGNLHATTLAAQENLLTSTRAYQVIDYYDHFVETSPTQPSFFPEFQGGSYNPWGGPEGGCPADIGADFANLFYRNLISQRVTALSLYMMYGGTNWGAFACPVVATSYDYSSPISENRKIDAKFYETKNLALFTRVAQDLTETDRLGNNTGYTTNAAIEASELRNPVTKSAFYVTIHETSSSSTKESFKLHVSSSIGNITIPQHGGSIVLDGHQSKILVTDFAIGNDTLTYSTAEVLTYAMVEGNPIVVLTAGSGEDVEFHIKDAKRGHYRKGTNATFIEESHGLTTNIRSISSFSVFEYSNNVRVVVVDKQTAYKFWAPNLSNDPFAPVDQSGEYSALLLGSEADVYSPCSRSVSSTRSQPRWEWSRPHRRCHGRNCIRSVRLEGCKGTLLERPKATYFTYLVW